MVALERLEQHRGRSAASHLLLKPLLSSSVSHFVCVVASLVGYEVAERRGIIVWSLRRHVAWSYTGGPLWSYDVQQNDDIKYVQLAPRNKGRHLL